MKIDFNQSIKDLNDNPVKIDGEDLTLKTVCVNALLSADAKEELEGDEKLRRYELAQEIQKGDRDSLKAEEIVLLKELVARFFTTLVVGQVYQMIDKD